MEKMTKAYIIDHLQTACYLLRGVVDRSMDEDYALDEIGEVLGHIKDIEATGDLPAFMTGLSHSDPRD